MKKIFDDAKDKNVATFVVYGDTTDNKLYLTATGDNKVQVKQVELEDAFNKRRLLIVVGDATFVPVSIAANKVKTIDVVSNAVSLIEWAAAPTVAG